MIQYNTKNLSFLKMYTILKDFGVENNSFFLELYDEGLIDIDPLDENLSRDIKLRVHNEIARNPWYYLREVVRIPTAGEKRMFELTRATLALCWATLNDLSSFVVLPRQCYKTYSICAIYSWMLYWGCRNSEFMMFSYSDSILQGNLQRIKEIRDTLPEYLNLHDPRTDKDNSREIRFVTPDYYNHIRIKAPSKSPDEASKVGRGFSTALMWFDELNFIPQIGEIYNSSSFAYKTVADIAKKNGSHHHRIMSSSVGRLDDDSGIWGFNFLNSSCDFTEKMYDYNKEEVMEMISRNSTNNFLRIEYMYYDLGKPDSYIDEMRKDSVSEDAFQREVLNKWAKTSGNHPLGKELVDTVSNYITEPKDVLVIDNVYFLKLYRKVEDIDFNKRYVIGIDCGGNLLRDFSTFVVVDPSNYEVVAVMRTNSFSTNRFAKAIVNVLLNVFTNSIIVPERNNMGIAIIDFITENFPMLVRRVYHDEEDKPGFATTKKSRDLLYNSLLRISVINEYKLLHDKNIINEIIGLQVTRNGRVDHQPGGHDDTLLGYLFTRWFMMYAKNMGKYIDINDIGINSGNNETNVREDKSNNTRSNILKNLKFQTMGVDGESMNPDGTLNMDSLNPMKIMNRMQNDRNYVNSQDVSDTMDKISSSIFNSKVLIERSIEKLESKDLLDNEEEMFDANPEELKKDIKTTSEKSINKVQTSYFQNHNISDFRNVLGL